MKPSKKPYTTPPKKKAVVRGSIEHKLLQLYNRIDEVFHGEDEILLDKKWVWTLVERVQNNEHLTKAVLLKANNLWRTYA